MKRVLQTLAVAMILGGSVLAQQETAPEIYLDKPMAQQQQQVAQKKQPATHKAVVAKKQQTSRKATLVAAKTGVKPASTRSN